MNTKNQSRTTPRSPRAQAQPRARASARPHVRPSVRGKPKLLIISPAKDEAKYIERTIASVAAQTVTPALWVIVDDGSSDRTGELADAAAAKYPWIKVLHRPAGTARRVGPGVIEAFYAGLDEAEAAGVDYDYICKLDADLEFPPDYFERLFARFDAEPALGTVSGKAYIPAGGRFVLERSGDQFSHGVAKLFRRECFEQIGGFVREVMWDGIDCHRCRMLGWSAESDNDPALAIKHLRQMGSSYRSVYHGRLRWGRGQYFMGTHPLYILAIMAYRMLERPWVVGGLLIGVGYLQAALQGRPRYEDPAFRSHLHRWQLAELSEKLLGPLRRLFGRKGEGGSDRGRPSPPRYRGPINGRAGQRTDAV
ncbi:MAG: glycosyltransferase family A protein [Isosphaeraceae bacterium]